MLWHMLSASETCTLRDLGGRTADSCPRAMAEWAYGIISYFVVKRAPSESCQSECFVPDQMQGSGYQSLIRYFFLLPITSQFAIVLHL